MKKRLTCFYFVTDRTGGNSRVTGSMQRCVQLDTLGVGVPGQGRS